MKPDEAEEFKNLLTPILDVVELTINTSVFKMGEDVKAIYELKKRISSGLDGIKNRNDIQAVKQLLLKGSKKETCDWVPLDTKLRIGGHAPSCNEKDIGFKYCPYCGKEIIRKE